MTERQAKCPAYQLELPTCRQALPGGEVLREGSGPRSQRIHLARHRPPQRLPNLAHPSC